MTKHAILRWNERVNSSFPKSHSILAIKDLCKKGKIWIDNYVDGNEIFRYIMSEDHKYVIITKKLNDFEFLAITVLTCDMYKRSENQLISKI